MTLRAGPDIMALIARLAEIAKTVAGAVALPNEVDLARVIELGLIPALHSPALALRGAAHVRSPEPVPTEAARSPAAVSIASRSAAPRFERPVVILAAPRSGSSLVFETLAHSPDSLHGRRRKPSAIRVDTRVAARRACLPIRSTGPARCGAGDPCRAQAEFRAIPPQPRRQASIGGSRRGASAGKDAQECVASCRCSTRCSRTRFTSSCYREPQENVSSIIEGWESGRFVMYPDLPGWRGLPWSFLLVPGWRELAAATARGHCGGPVAADAGDPAR